MTGYVRQAGMEWARSRWLAHWVWCSVALLTFGCGQIPTTPATTGPDILIFGDSVVADTPKDSSPNPADSLLPDVAPTDTDTADAPPSDPADAPDADPSDSLPPDAADTDTDAVTDTADSLTPDAQPTDADTADAPPSDPADASTQDAPVTDVAPIDAATADTQPNDGSPIDTEPLDAATTDSQPSDPADASLQDAPSTDAAPTDVAPIDIAMPDAPPPDIAPIDAAAADSPPSDPADAPIIDSLPPDTEPADIADTAPTDAPADSADATASLDVGPAGPEDPCVGAYCPCTTPAQCLSGTCVDDQSASYCAKPCTQDEVCKPSEACVQTTEGGSVSGFCAPRFASLCSPCQTNADCRQGPIAGNPTCEANGDQGSFCVAKCGFGDQCPDGFGCVAGSCTPIGGTCACSEWSVKFAATTTCGHSNIHGTCLADLECTAAGPMPACLASTPTLETCNGIDDGSNGLTDEVGPEACDDNNACTTDSCQSPACQHAPIDPCTQDSNPCTVDACDPAVGCTQTFADGEACTDDEPCTAGEHCAGGACVDAIAVTCDDGDPCTTDFCQSGVGCDALPNTGGPCSDGNACTEADTCASGQCTGTAIVCVDANPCTDDGCAGGACTYTPNSTPCSDTNPCTTGDTCGPAGCVGTAKSCDDGFACTSDACDGETGACVNTPGAPTSCDDGQVCTDDSCAAGQGCLHLSNAATCTDNSACTDGDGCVGGECLPGAQVTCNDGNSCTTDTCSPASGCVFTNTNGQACSDGDPCSSGETCQSGTCTTGSIVECAPGVLAYQRLDNLVALDDLRKVTWHPSGDFALILGVSGKVLRYTHSTKALTLETTLGKNVVDLDVHPDGSYFLILGTDSTNLTRVWRGDVGSAYAMTWSADVTVTGNPVAIAVQPGGASFAIGTYTGSSPYITYLRRWQAGAITATQAANSSAGLWDLMWTGAGVLPAIGGSDAVITSHGVNGTGSHTWIIDNNTIVSNSWGGGFGNAGGAGWRPGGTFGIVAGWTSNIVYVYDGAWKSTYLPGLNNGYNPIAVGWRANGQRALITGNIGGGGVPLALVFEYRAGTGSAYDSTLWVDQRIADWDKPPWSGTGSLGHLLDVAWRPGTKCDEGLIVGRDLSSSTPTYGMLIRFYDLNDGACPP